MLEATCDHIPEPPHTKPIAHQQYNLRVERLRDLSTYIYDYSGRLGAASAASQRARSAVRVWFGEYCFAMAFVCWLWLRVWAVLWWFVRADFWIEGWDASHGAERRYSSLICFH
jgi:hypothetical protein